MFKKDQQILYKFGDKLYQGKINECYYVLSLKSNEDIQRYKIKSGEVIETQFYKMNDLSAAIKLEDQEISNYKIGDFFYHTMKYESPSNTLANDLYESIFNNCSYEWQKDPVKTMITDIKCKYRILVELSDNVFEGFSSVDESHIQCFN